MDLPFAEYAPDTSDYSPQFSDKILNVEPTIDGYGSLPGFAEIGTGLGAEPRGAWTVRLANGGTAIYAATATKLWKLDPTDSSWTDVTRTSGGDYSTPADIYWSGAQFGSRLIVCNGVDDTQYIDVDSGSNFAALPNAPIASYVVVAKDHVVLLKLSTDATAAAWCGVNNSEWWTYGQRGSDQQIFPSGGLIQGGVGFDTGFVVLMQTQNHAMDWVGGNLIFRRRLLHNQIGCFSPNSIIPVRNTFYWYDQGGFYEGVEARPIGAERVNRFVASEATSGFRQIMRGTSDPSRKMVWWLIPTSANTYFMLGFDYMLNKWTRADMDVAYVFPAITPGYTIDGMDALGVTIDNLPYPVDSVFWHGTGVQSLAGFNADGDFGYFQATPLEAMLETHDLNLNPGYHSFLRSVRMISDADNANVSFKVGTRRKYGDSVTWTGSVSPSANTGIAPFRKDALTHRVQATITASQWNNANGLDIDAVRTGNR